MNDTNVSLPQFQPNFTSVTNSTPSGSYGSYDSTTAGAAAAQKKGGSSENLALGILTKMNQPGTAAAQGVGAVSSSKTTQGSQNTQFSGQSFTATMPPPSAPKVQITSSTQSAFQSFASESQGAMQNLGSAVSQQPMLQTTTPALQPGATPAQAAASAANWYANSAVGTAAFANGGLAAFMKMRIQTTDASINSMQQLAQSASDLQGDLAEEQEQSVQAAQNESQKANKKAGILGIFQKVFAVVLAIVCVVAAVLTCDPAIAAAGIAVALMAFVIAGAVKGGGKGFDFWGGLDIFNDTIGIIDGAALLKSLATSALKTGVGQAIKNGVKAGLEAAGEATGKVAGSVIGDSATTAVRDSMSTMARQMEKHIAQMMTKVETGLTKVGLQSAAKDAAQGGKVAKESGTKIGLVAAAVGGVQGADDIGSGIIQFQESTFQANADSDLADVDILKSMVKMLDSSYKTANDVVQTLLKSHSNAVDQTQAILKGNSDVMNLIAANMAQI